MEWISVKDALPENEVGVLVCVERNHISNKYRFIMKAFYENGKYKFDESDYNWNTYDCEYDDEIDEYIIPKGWYEYPEYQEEFFMIDGERDVVTHWMPLPEMP